MTDRGLYKLHAGICHILANPKRLEIIDLLRGGELTVAELTATLEISQSNLSQHLSLMRERGILSVRREGLKAFYSMSSPKILQACELMREVLVEHLDAEANLARGASRTKEKNT